jgi:hypothetical protein
MKMTDYKNTETAPLIFFDGAIAWGTYAGVVQIEFGARALCATTDGDLGAPAEVAVHVFGRLRCSPAAARQLRDVIDKSLEKLEQPHGADVAAPVAGKLN